MGGWISAERCGDDSVSCDSDDRVQEERMAVNSSIVNRSVITFGFDFPSDAKLSILLECSDIRGFPSDFHSMSTVNDFVRVFGTDSHK